MTSASVPAGAAKAGQGISAAPYGYGMELAEWSPLTSKLGITHQLTLKWAVSASIVHYAGFPGATDYWQYVKDDPTITGAGVPRSDNSDPYGQNLYVDVGLQYQPSKNWTIRLDGRNLGALWDKDSSKRNYYFRLSEVSVEPAQAALSVKYSL